MPSEKFDSGIRFVSNHFAKLAVVFAVLAKGTWNRLMVPPNVARVSGRVSVEVGSVLGMFPGLVKGTRDVLTTARS